jgi:hypothetical protein
LRIAFLGLAQNCEKTLPNARYLFEEIWARGHDIEIFIGEDGSKDLTRSILDQYEKDFSKVSIVDTLCMSKIADRLERMAHGRELLKNTSAQSHQNAPYEYVIVCDLDNVFKEKVDVNSILLAIRTLGRGNDLFAVSAKSKPYYYDILALHDPSWFNHDASRYFKFMSKVPLGKAVLIGVFIFPWQILLTAIGDFNAHSSFNGLAIYKANEFFQASYIQPAALAAPCEHVVLNRTIARKTGQRIRSLEYLLVSMPPEHGPRGIKWALSLMKRASVPWKL